MKWLYIKNGNVAAQLKRLGACPSDPPEGGPDAFLGDFLSKNNSPKLLVSWDIVNDDVTDSNTRAVTCKVGGSRLRILGNIVLRTRALGWAAYTVMRYRPDRIICGRVGAMLWLTWFLSLLMRQPYIHSRHNSLLEDRTGIVAYISSLLDLFCIRRAKAVICHGPFLADQVIGAGVSENRVFVFDVGYRSFCAGNAVDAAIAIPDIDRRKTLLYVGRMAENKGIYDLLQAAGELVNDGINVAVVYIGDGPDVQGIKDAAASKGLSEIIDVKGRVPHAQLPGYIRRSYLVVTPTRSEFPEGRCMSAMEGLACGVPVLAPDNGPFPYLVKDGDNGLLYRVDDVDDMKRKIRLSIQNGEAYKVMLEGAARSKKELEVPELTFYGAVEKAFAELSSTGK